VPSDEKALKPSILNRVTLSVRARDAAFQQKDVDAARKESKGDL
jgi:hypothetical protein